jgi:uncharacterized protein (TIGR02145 family)
MKKNFYLMLALLVLSAAGANAQVTIGSLDEPHPGAVLDLHSSSQGLLLPTVSLGDVSVFQLATDTFRATGMTVYNTNPVIGEGLYVWNGKKWKPVGSGVSTDPNVVGPGETIVVGSNTYTTYCYPIGIGCWMTQNSKEGNYYEKTYPGHSEGERGYYYEWSNASSACPPHWSLPTRSQWVALQSYISGLATLAERDMWLVGDANKSGYAYTRTNPVTWYNWDNCGIWFSDGQNGQFLTNQPGELTFNTETSFRGSVRCIKD